jgi:predicted acyltransferase (DUF342 family)
MKITETLEVDGNVMAKADVAVTGNITAGGNGTVTGNIEAGSFSGTGGGTMSCGPINSSGQVAGASLTAGNGATGTFTSVTVVDGIVTSGT